MALTNRISLQSQLFLVFIGFVAHCGVAQAAANAQWISPEPSPRQGEAIEIRCRAEWSAGDSVPNVLPAQTPSLEWGTLELLRTESGFDGGKVHIDHVFLLNAATPGTFMLPPLDIPYFDGKVAAAEEMPSVQAPSMQIEIRQFNRALYTAVAAAALTAFIAALIIALRLRKNAAQSQMQPDQTGPKLDLARAALNRARNLRVNGDFYACYQAMAEAVSVLGAEQETLAADLAKRAQTTGYSGTRPDDTLLDSDFRAVERAIAQIEDSETSDRKQTENQNEVAKI